MIILSNMDADAKRVYGTYHGREEVEQQFDTFKSTLHSDIMYLMDEEAVFGHIFVAFLSLYGYCTIQNMLRSAALLEKASPADLLEVFSSVCNNGRREDARDRGAQEGKGTRRADRHKLIP